MSFAPHILFPVDFSERCNAVRPYVISMAERLQAKITLIHVLEPPAVWYANANPALPMMVDITGMAEDSRKQLDAFLGKPAPGVSVETVVDHGDAATRITCYAEQHGVGLIMMPTHGYGKFRGLLLGSVTAKVLHDAKCPVWTAAHTEDPELPGRADIKSILCAVDLQPESVALICYAADLAREFKADLRLVHAVPLAAPAAKYSDTDFVGWLFHKSRLEIAKFQEQAGTNVDALCDGWQCFNTGARYGLGIQGRPDSNRPWQAARELRTPANPGPMQLFAIRHVPF